MLDPGWRLSLTLEKPGQGIGKSGSLPDCSQLLNCILKTSAIISSLSNNRQTEWGIELPLYSGLTFMPFFFNLDNNKVLYLSFPLWN